MWMIVAVVASVVAVAGWVAPSPRGLSRLDTRGAGRLRRWLAGRPGALPGRLRAVGGGVVAGVVAILGGDWPWWIAGVVAGAGVGIGLGWWDLGRERKIRRGLVAGLPQALALIEACLRAGLPIRAALREVVAVTEGPLGDELRRVLDRVDVGESDRVAWLGLRDDPVLGALARDIARGVESGTSLVPMLARHEVEARRSRQAALEVRAKTVGVQVVLPLTVCFLPAFLCVGVVPVVAGIALRLFG